MIGSLFQYRKFIWRNAFHEFRHRYAGSSMGVLWNILHPIAMIAIYSLVFGQIMKSGAGGSKFAYMVYLCSGLFPWMAFADCVTRGCTAFVANANYLRKLPIPEPVFIAQVLITSCINLVISFGLLLVFAIAVGQRPTVYWLFVPLPLILLQLLGFAVAMLVGTLNVFFRDMEQWVGIVLGVFFWTVPIVYDVATMHLPDWYLKILPWHPIAPALSATRDLLIHSRWPDGLAWINMIAWPAAVGLVAVGFLSKLRDEIRDVI
jgi:ABC-type polysaccharide/polyol phosphate export permease